jgi:hypothetical protein
MPTYNVHMNQTVSTTVTVEADNPEHAIELAYKSDDMPGSMCYGAFGSASVDEAGDWEVAVVSDSSGNEVWSAEAAGAA